MSICQCGCGQEIPITKWSRKHNVRFIRNHWWNLDEYKEKIRKGNKKRIKKLPDICKSVGRRFKNNKYYSRWLMEQHLGRKLSSTEFVHHINGNKTDDRIENLQVISKADHVVLHHTVRRMIEYTCEGCGKKFYRKEWQNRKGKRKYCTQQCFFDHSLKRNMSPQDYNKLMRGRPRSRVTPSEQVQKVWNTGLPYETDEKNLSQDVQP